MINLLPILLIYLFTPMMLYYLWGVREELSNFTKWKKLKSTLTNLIT